MLERWYGTPGVKVGRRFMRELIYKLQGVQERRWNTKIFIVSQALILQRARHVTGVQEIWRRIGKHLDAWEAGQHQILVD